jgi:hypothetical protein
MMNQPAHPLFIADGPPWFVVSGMTWGRMCIGYLVYPFGLLAGDICG